MAGTRWHVSPALATFIGQFNASFPGRDKRSDGTIGDLRHQHEAGGSDHDPDPTGTVCAFDGTHGPYWHLSLADAGRIANELVASGDERIAYVIFNRRIWTKAKGWHDYTGVSPHLEHFHLSVKHGAPANDDSPWHLPSFGLAVPTVSVSDLVAAHTAALATLTLPPTTEDDDMSDKQLQIVQASGREGVLWLRDGGSKSHIVDTQALEQLQALITLAGGDPQIHTISGSLLDSFGAS